MQPSNRPSFIVAGLGLSARARTEDALALVADRLRCAGLDLADVDVIATIASRGAHPVAGALAKACDARLESFDAIRLEQETPRLLNPSPALFARIGCHGVAEAAALAASGPSGRLIVAKTAGEAMTVAIAIVYAPADAGRVAI